MNEKEILFLYSLYEPEDGNLEGTKHRFFANPPKIDALHEELHSQLAFLFSKFKQFCDDNEIDYFLMGGSCIGAIRQGGIVPWDVDGDVGMLRKDYVRFKELVQDSDYIELIERPTIININDVRTCFLKKKVAIKGTSHTASIDIIVWDRVDIDEGYSVKSFWNISEGYKTETPLTDEDDVAEFVKNLPSKFLEDYGSEDGNYLIWGIDNFKSVRAMNPVRILPYDSVFPLDTISFLGDSYKVCNDVYNYIEQEWGDIWTISISETYEGETQKRKIELLSNDREVINAMQ